MHRLDEVHRFTPPKEVSVNKRMAILAALVAVTAGSASATEMQFNNYCTAGSIRTCASLKVVTNWNATLNRNEVQVWVRNLQGTHNMDNTGGSPITRVGLTAPILRNVRNFAVTTDAGTGEYGNASSYWAMRNSLIEGPVTFSTSVPNSSPEGGIMGCVPYPGAVVNYFQTCGTGYVIFSFTTTNLWDASQAQVAWKIQTNANDQDFYACRSDAPISSPEYCGSFDPIPPVATPEPVTVVLLGSGLAAMAGKYRRRKNGAEEFSA